MLFMPRVLGECSVRGILEDPGVCAELPCSFMNLPSTLPFFIITAMFLSAQHKPDTLFVVTDGWGKVGTRRVQ